MPLDGTLYGLHQRRYAYYLNMPKKITPKKKKKTAARKVKIVGGRFAKSFSFG